MAIANGCFTLARVKPDLSVIIPSYNTAALLQECIVSITAQRWRARVEVIVVDNASRDGSVEMTRRTFPDVAVVESPVNRGYSAACNAGAARSQGDVLLFLNSDTRVLDRTLDAIVDVFNNSPEVDAAACHEISTAGETVLGCRSHHTLRSGISFLSGYRLFRREGDRYLVAGWDRKTDRFVDNISGFAWAVRRELFQALGGFDENLFLYFEEQDVALRLQRVGCRIKYLATARILHHGARSSIDIGRWGRRRQWVESFVYLRRKHRLSGSAWLDRIVLYPFLLMWWLGNAVKRQLG